MIEVRRKQVKVTRFTPPTLKTSGAIVYAHGGGYVANSVKARGARLFTRSAY